MMMMMIKQRICSEQVWNKHSSSNISGPGHISPSLHARDDQDYEHDDGDEKCYNIKITMMAIIFVAHMVIFSWSEL